ncbi:MAG: hypothetical protein ACYTX0_54270 [Nostoc sp.]
MLSAVEIQNPHFDPLTLLYETLLYETLREGHRAARTAQVLP